MTATAQPTCAERIDDMLKQTLDDFRSKIKVYNYAAGGIGYEEYGEPTDEDIEEVVNELGATLDKYKDDPSLEETAIQAWDETPIGISVSRVVKIELSWGGPADFFEVEIDESGRIDGRITYHFQDWFDGAKKDLEGADYELAKDFLERFTEIALL